MALNTRQEQFKNNLLKGMGHQEAYEAVDGYKATGKVAAAAATRLLNNVNFKAVYEREKEKAANAAVVTKERVLREDCRIAYSDIGQIFDGDTTIAPSKLPEDIRRAISSFEIKEKVVDEKTTERTYRYRFWDKGKALERLGRHLGIFERDNEQSRPLVMLGERMARANERVSETADE
jgi:phage terminase small subunit